MSVQRIRNKVLAAATALVVGGGLFVGLAPLASRASSHREAPLTAADPQIDNTDVYAFVSPDAPDTVTFVATGIPFEEPNGGPNFYLFAEHANYNINISNDGEAKPDTRSAGRSRRTTARRDTFLYNNGSGHVARRPHLIFHQTYTSGESSNGGTRPASCTTRRWRRAVGAASMPNYNGVCSTPQPHAPAARTRLRWVGQSDDPFFLDLRVFDLLYGGDLTEAVTTPCPAST